ncbi:sporulation protein [Saccharopolyspora hirsuta]|uniref:Sporulation protein n=1 Tax=Saccharopolyspora hirsuta TaxID=1837 RepID=A0A5M7BN89_SACHI|nr:sporulation protein [Saccharopolyspora hirsuta]KAA5830490.1 sporulation protein [Saccharopolyspora hirsuta]
MVFKKLLGALGIGAPSVDTVLQQPYVHPGQNLAGEVRIAAGKQDIAVEHVALSFAAHVETGYEDPVAVELHRAEIAGAFQLRGGEQKVIPFELPVPWDVPITNVRGMVLDGIGLGVHTELRIAEVASKSDLDPIAIEPLPAQAVVLDAIGQLGLQFHGTGLGHGRVPGVPRELPFVQEIEFFPPPQYAGRLHDVWLTFVADADGLTVCLDAGKRSGIPTPGVEEDFGRFRVGHEEALTTDWTGRIQTWLEQVSQARAGLADHEHGHLQQRRGSGIGGAVAGAALGAGAGIVGGMVIGEVLDEAFEDDEEF